MPFSTKLVIAFTVLILLIGPYLTYKMLEVGRNEDVNLARTISDRAAIPVDREVAEIKHQYLPPIVFGQIGMLIVAQVGMVGLSVLLIREHKRRQRLGNRR